MVLLQLNSFLIFYLAIATATQLHCVAAVKELHRFVTFHDPAVNAQITREYFAYLPSAVYAQR